MDLDEEQVGNVERPRRAVQWLAGTVAAAGLLAIGALAGAYWGVARAPVTTTGTSSLPASPLPGRPPAQSIASDEPVEVTLTPEVIKRAGIKVAQARVEPITAAINIPGTVTSNAYRETKVNALVGGIVRNVSVELGTSVRRGQVLAVVFSNELAEAQMKYVSMLAMLAADHQKLERVRKLESIGAVSRQEVEEVTAVHEMHAAEQAAYRQRLLLLGLSPEQISRLRDASHVVSEVAVPAAADGVVISRAANPGQVVASGQELFVVADLTSVWVIGDVYENDFAAARVGALTTVVIPTAPDRPLRGRVTYIDPRLDPSTRTAKVRVEVPQRESDLRLGTFVRVVLDGASERRVVIRQTAVQSIGERNVVYVATDEEGRFAERTVMLGAAVGDAVHVMQGLEPGERVVTEGSFFLRSEATRSRSGG